MRNKTRRRVPPARARQVLAILFLIAVAAGMVLILTAPASAADPYAVGETVTTTTPMSTVSPWSATDRDTVLALDGAEVRFVGGGGGVPAVDVLASGTATFWLYAVAADNSVTARYGPFQLRNWMPPRSPVPPGKVVDLLQVTAISGAEVVVTPRRTR